MGDHVGDRLTLAGAWRTDDDKILSPVSGRDRGHLGRVGRKSCKQVRRFVIPVKAGGLDKINFGRIRGPWRLDQMPHHFVLAKRVAAVDKVLPHEILGEGEVTETHFLDDFESRHVFYFPAYAVPYAVYVDAALILGQLAVKVFYVN